ncbi:endoglucanase Acf2 [Paenibacillus phyllosphaerae]|uniref:glucan endo-1,3-beta-D-glucosidase n=1 Tax=Paenibacillus phyllosphaerae TaxID=274593 RepID=A0A7W5ATP2_9BACL|nr:discoidin domain-containing protein [Paenibacillus phyllosphaerae]MBB3108604.1 endoglucanase Acf2 [Paenibacillus phyllosphaerae]
MKLTHQPSTRLRKTLIYMLSLSMLLSMVTSLTIREAQAAGSYLLSQGRTAYASSSEGANAASLAVDGNTATRWGSAWGSDPQWIYIDLGAQATIDRVKIQWEGAYAKAYKIQVSSDEMTWNDVYSTTTSDGATDDVTLSGTGRFVRVYGTQRALAAYGYSIVELEVYGTGGVNLPPTSYGPNVALGKPVTASSYEQSAYLPAGSTLPANAVDGNPATRWSSNATDSEWFAVDLGASRTIGRIVLNWEAAYGRAFDLQVSANGTQWTTVYRDLRGAGGKQEIPVYATGRYVRMNGIGRGTTFGYSLLELEVYDYVAGEPQPTYTIEPLPTPQTVQAGAGSYLTNDLKMPQPKYPANKSASVTTPIASNDWWQSILIKPMGDYLITLPLKSKFFPQGLGLLNPGAGWLNSGGTAVNADGNPDLYVMNSAIDSSKMKPRVTGIGDWSVDTVLSDDATDKMKTTFVKGSPYVYSTFSDPNSVEIYSPLITQLFDDSGASVLTTDGQTLTTDHIGVKLVNTDGSPNATPQTRYYGIFAPPGTVITKAGAKLKIKLGGGQNYLAVAALPSAADLNYFYQHAYAFVTGTQVSYDYNESTSQVTTNFNVTTSLKRTGFSNQTLMALYPHQWKVSSSPLTTLTYPSVRGTLKVREGNSFTTVDRFYGIVPQFVEPTNPEYSKMAMISYLQALDEETTSNLMAADAYWQGKKLHPLAMGVLAANEMGETAYRDKFLARIKTILTDWYTYTSGEPDYFFYYNNDWGTTYYRVSEFGANNGITDHHFTYGYYVFASAVLATFDDSFRTQYGPMVEHLIRDYANPSHTDPLYPFFRSFDPYEGHSWAGGYADNDSGNNQEAAGESLFGWVGQYMWSLLTGDTVNRNTAIYGFTTELKAVEQYWFNYDNDNWLPQWTHKTVGQVYGSSNFYGTFFSGAPVHIYGIHWLPTAEYLTSYGLDPAKAASLYNGFVTDNGGPETDWQHIVWPIQALSDPQGALAKWDASKLQRNEIFNTYWFVNSMATLGTRTKDVWATGWSSATVYKKGTAYTAVIWNPTANPVTVTFTNASGTTGTAVVAAHSLVTVNPMTSSNAGDNWAAPGSGGNNGGGNEGGGDNGGNTGTNVALGKTVTVSSTEAPFAGTNATDGSGETRWASVSGADPQWLSIDLGTTHTLSKVKLNWEAAYAKSYKIQVSQDGSTWTDVYSTTTGDGAIDEVNVSGTGRYVRIYGTERGTIYGYSLYEVDVYGTLAPAQNASLLSLNQSVTASSVQDPFVAAAAVDGDNGTRWGSATGIDPSWITVDLGQSRTVTRIKLSWEAAYAKSFKLQISADGTNWTDLYSTTTGTGGDNDLTVSGTGRYVRMYGTERATPYGYSLWNFEVYGY